MLGKFINSMTELLKGLGSFTRFTGGTLKVIACEGVPISLLFDQLYQCGVKAVTTTVASGFFVGAIMAIQIELQLRNFGAEGAVGGIATSVTIRNVGPVLIGFILVGKVGALTTAVLGTMRVTDQIDALTCLGVNPIRLIVAPRLLASIVASFLLLIIGLVVSVFGGAIIAQWSFSTNPIYYMSQIPKFVGGWSVATGAIKSLFFGAVIGCVACYRGYFVKGGASAVGEAVRGAAISSLILIIVLDLGLSHVIETFLKWVNG